MSSSALTTTTTSLTTIHYHCQNFDKLHQSLRKKSLGASAIGAIAGHSIYDDPQTAWRKLIGIETHPYSEACKHGHICEPESGKQLLFLMKSIYPEIVQTVDEVSGYDMPKLGENDIFVDEIDYNHNGCSIDRRGSVIDCEIKNPFVYISWKKSYSETVKPTVFDQCQHTMAIRKRDRMLLYCTSFAKFNPEILLAECLWEIKFSKEYYMKHLYGPGRIVTEALSLHCEKSKDDPTIPRELEGLPDKDYAKSFESSQEWLDIFNQYCVKQYCKVYGGTCRMYFEQLNNNIKQE